MSSSTLEDKNCAGSEYEKEFNEEEEEDEEEKERDDPKTEEPALQKTWRPAWAPRFVSNSNKEVYYYVDQKIIIQEGLDSFAGMISLAATALCHYLDTHREQLRLLDKAVLEIGAGTGLVSIVATLLGAQVTATDQPQILNNLRMNVRRNTRDCCRYTPQVAALSWGHDLEHTYPTSVYRYDYVLAADVASHYYCLDKLLVTMKHFCKPGTTLVWANKVRSEADLTFIENFKKTFNASLLAEDGDMKIFMATSRDGEIREEHLEQNYCEVPLDSTEPDEDQNKDVSGTIVNCDRSEDLCRDEKEQNDELKSDEEAGNVREDGYTEDTDSDCTMSSSTLEDCAGSEYEKEFNEEEEEDEEEKERDDPKTEEPALQKTWRPAWAPRFVSNSNKEVYYYVDQKIIIQEGFDSFAGMISLAATALCHYLDTHREQLRLLDKAVLEIGAGTGLVSIVATLLGAQVTATDQPQILNNLRMNVRRNTRDCCRYTPQVAALSWGHDLEHTYPTSVYRYDYVLAADVASHYYCLDKLLVTMKHFCKPGTTLVWANKVRSEADLTFIENFKTTFNASLLAEDGDMKIFMATSRDGDIGEEHLEQNYCEVPLDSTEPDEDQNKDVSGTIVNCDRSEDLCRDEKEQNDELKSDEEAGNVREDGYTEDTDSDCTMSSSTLEDCAGSEYEKEFNEEEEEDEEEKERDDPKTEEPALQKTWRPAWAPRFVSNSNKEVYYYVDQKIIIQEGFDSFAGMISLAATALCHYLDTHREQLRLLDKAVLEIGAGTGLVSIVATLLGAQVTATDQPQILNNLRMNVRRNTRDCCRYTPQVAALSWGHDLEHTYPTSVYRYDYVLAADVASHYYCLDKLLVTMKHFCKPGTTLVWANKVRSEADLTFIQNFKKTFNASLLAEDGDMKIFMATSRDGEIREEHLEQNYCEVPLDSTEPDEDQNKDVSGTIVNCDRSEDLCRDEKEQNDELKSDEEAGNVREDGYTEDTDSVENSMEQTTMMHYSAHNIKKDIYHYVGQDIIIQESIDSNVMWPAALALCSFLDNNRDVLKFQGKKVLELGAGTGLVSIVASLLGASVTATDLKDVLANLRANVMRNTRGRCKHMPKVDNLSWGNDLEHTYPSTVHRYDYVLAADVVYHHDFLNELLTTMKYFNKPGTTLIWANNVRFETDLTFTENFKKAFNTKLMSDDGEIKIFKAASK